MRAFIEAKERFVFHLRQQDILDCIHSAALAEMAEESTIKSALDQLCQWGNLQTEVDGTSVYAVEDFRNQRHTFRMTSAGEAAERALTGFNEIAGRETALERSGVTDIRIVLQDLKQLWHETEPDAGELYRHMLVLRALFEHLATTAQAFALMLQRSSGLQPDGMQALVDYGQQFIDELVLESDRIGKLIRDIEMSDFERLIRAVARHSAPERAGPMHETVADACNRWHSQWERFRIWFISEHGPSKAETLREHARASIPVLLSVITSIYDQRKQRIDRAGDFRVLARWFAEAKSDAEAHLLWRTAFGWCPARHLTIDDATLDDRETNIVPATTSWLDAPPLRISMRRRDRGGKSRTGGLSRIIDRSAEKEKLAAASPEEARRLLNAHRRFGMGNRIRLSELERLEPDEFEVFLDLLGEAVSVRVFSGEPVEVVSGDGCLRVRLEPTGDGQEALILTTEGAFSGPDHWLSIEQISTHEVPM
jgi:uncharacterized protein (TIGR02677 family)